MLNIFVFEGEAALRDSLAAFLKDDRCRIITPADFSEAIEAVMLVTFDLILCDYWIGEMDGLEFFHVIRDRQKTAIKVLVTGYPTHATPSDIRWAGIDYVIHKADMFKTMDTLKNSITATLQRRIAGSSH